MRSEAPLRRAEWLAALLLLGVGSVLMLGRLGWKEPWLDELIALAFTGQPLADLLRGAVQPGVGLVEWLGALARQVVPDPVLALRGLAGIGGVAAMALALRWAWRLGFSPVLAALAWLGCWPLLFLAREGKGYSLALALLLALSLTLSSRAAGDREPSRGIWAAAVALPWIHPFAVPVAGLLLWPAWRRGSRVAGWGLVALGGSLLLSGLHLLAADGLAWMSRPRLQAFLFSDLARALRDGLALASVPVPAGQLLPAAALAGIWALLREPRHRPALAAWIGGTVLVFGVVWLSRGVLPMRYLAFGVVPAWLGLLCLADLGLRLLRSDPATETVPGRRVAGILLLLPLVWALWGTVETTRLYLADRTNWNMPDTREVLRDWLAELPPEPVLVWDPADIYTDNLVYFGWWELDRFGRFATHVVSARLAAAMDDPRGCLPLRHSGCVRMAFGRVVGPEVLDDLPDSTIVHLATLAPVGVPMCLHLYCPSRAGGKPPGAFLEQLGTRAGGLPVVAGGGLHLAGGWLLQSLPVREARPRVQARREAGAR